MSKHFYIDLSDQGYWLIKSIDGKRYTAGYDKQKVINLIEKLNNTHSPNIIQGELNEIYVCWNEHEKGQKCDYIKEI